MKITNNVLILGKIKGFLGSLSLLVVILVLSACPMPDGVDNSPSITSSLSAGSHAEEGKTFTLSARAGGIQIAEGTWSQLTDTEALVVIANPNSAATQVTVYLPPESTSQTLAFRFTFGTQSIEKSVTVDAGNIDLDGDGLIEIRNLTMLHNMRYNLEGRSYKTSENAEGDSSGCPNLGGIATCRGYELISDLNFDTNGDGTWFENSGSYILDSNDSRSPYFEVENGGWLPIGDDLNPFASFFEGNGHTITGLAMYRDQEYIGFFGRTNANAVIQNLGLVNNLADFSGYNLPNSRIGGLVGYQENGKIIASYVDGLASAGGGNSDFIGGLVGYQNGGDIIASHATGFVSGERGNSDFVGGLVGYQIGGNIIASYATGFVSGDEGDYDFVGGLIGYHNDGNIIANYTTGIVSGGDGNFDTVGGLMGWKYDGTVIANYSTSSVDGGDGDRDRAGGLIGEHSGSSVVASYASGSVAGGLGDDDYVDNLIAVHYQGSLASFGFGIAIGETLPANAEGDAIDNQAVKEFTTEIANDPDGIIGNEDDSKWNSASDSTASAWNFETRATANAGGPALQFADYDGDGDRFYCDGEVPPTPDLSIRVPSCGQLIPGQR